MSRPLRPAAASATPGSRNILFNLEQNWRGASCTPRETDSRDFIA